MKTFAGSQIDEWCKNKGISLTEEMYATFLPVRHTCLAIVFPETPRRIAALANSIMECSSSGSYDDSFEGGCLWFREVDRWDNRTNEAGLAMLSMMRSGFGEQKSIKEVPGISFVSSEARDALAFFLLPTMFGWDALFVNEKGTLIVLVSHDGYVCLVPGSEELLDRLEKTLSEWSPNRKDFYFKAGGVGR